MGNGPVSYKSRERDSIVVGTTAAFFDIRQMEIGQGSNLPDTAAGRRQTGSGHRPETEEANCLITAAPSASGSDYGITASASSGY